jgi:hypothetical protein
MILDLKDKIIIFLTAVLVVGILGCIIFIQNKNTQALATQQQTIIATQQLADNINRAMSTFATKADMTAFAQQNNINLQVVQDNLKTLNATLTAISQATATSSGQNSTNVPSTGSTSTAPEPTSTVTCDGNTVTCTNPDKYNYLSKRQTLDLNENFPAPAGATATIVPIGTVGFTASQAQPWDVTVAPRSYNLTTTLGTKNDGSDQQVAYNQLTINTEGKDYNVPISKNQFLQQTPSASFSFWNPRLYLGVTSGVNIEQVEGNVTPVVDLGIMSYGTSKTQPDWSIIDVGVGYDTVSHQGQVSVMPFSYNVGKVFKPLVRNLYLGPILNIGFNGNLSPGAGIIVGL